MRTKHLFSVLMLIMMAFCPSMMKAQQMPPIPVDEAVRIGKLDCGLTYYIRHNDYPEHRVNFYIAQRVGSIQEEESQRGLAHFLEHMAFNGSEHFNGEGHSIIDYTRSLGVAFGQDLNAYTGTTETVYNINDVPSTRQSAIDSCLLILKDWSGGLLLTDEEIDKERGVIHEEWRLSRSANMRMLENNLEALFPGSKYGKRMPIGLLSVVDNFKYNELRDYYHKWYQPWNQALVIVGDVDVDHIEAQIKELFKDCALDPNAAQVTLEPVPDNEEAIYVIDKDKEQTRSEIEIMFKHEAFPREMKTGMEYLIVQYLSNIGSSMLDTRLGEKAQEPDCPFSYAYSEDGKYIFANSMDAFSLMALPKEGQTEASIQELMAEALRVAQHGFTESEYLRAREEYLSRLEKRYNERNKISNEYYGRLYCSNFTENEPIASIEQTYEIMNQLVPYLSVELVNNMFGEYISNTDENLVVLNFNQEKDGAVYPTVDGFRDAINTARNTQLDAYVDNVKQEPLITNLPKKGKIVKETANSTFGYKELELSNGVHVILKKTDFKENEIIMSAIRRGGQSLYNEKDWMNAQLMDATISMSGLGNFSSTELQKALAGKQASVNFNMGDSYDEFSGNTTVKDLETLFQLFYLNFTKINKDEKSYNQLMSLLETQLKNKDLQPESALNDTINYVTNNRDWHYKPIRVEDLQKMDYDRALQMVKDVTANAADYTFIIVGAFDEATVRPLLEQYVASLPAKKGKTSNWKNMWSHPHGETLCHFSRKMETPKAYAYVIWGDDQTPYTLENSVKVYFLGQVLDKIYNQKIREDAGAAYSTSAFGYSTFEGDGTLTPVVAYCPVKPEFTDMALQIMKDEMNNACKSIDPVSLQEIKENALKEHATNLKENSYWFHLIRTYVLVGKDRLTGYEDLVNAQTPESIAAFARKLVNNGNRIEIVMTPEE